MPHNEQDKTISHHAEETSAAVTSSAEYTHTITIIKFQGEMWDHSATILGKVESVTQDNYFSIYPQKENAPTVGDPEDSIAAMRMVMFNIKRMLYTGMHFEKPDELTKFPHEKIEFPVTKVQFEQAQKIAAQTKEFAQSNKHKYSVFATKSSYSCAGHQHLILENITTPSEKESLPFLSKVWPTKTFKMAQDIAEARQKVEMRTSVTSSSAVERTSVTKELLEHGLFSPKGLLKSWNNALTEKRERSTLPFRSSM